MGTLIPHQRARLRQEYWEARAVRLGVAGQVAFLGSLPHTEVHGQLVKADVFVFTSLRDSAGFALLEAMSAGLPVVCLDWAGPGDITTNECAIRIRPESPEQVVTGLAKALRRLEADPALRGRLGLAGRERVAACFSWSRKAEEIDALYGKMLNTAPLTKRNPPSAG